MHVYGVTWYRLYVSNGNNNNKSMELGTKNCPLLKHGDQCPVRVICGDTTVHVQTETRWLYISWIPLKRVLIINLLFLDIFSIVTKCTNYASWIIADLFLSVPSENRPKSSKTILSSHWNQTDRMFSHLRPAVVHYKKALSSHFHFDVSTARIDRY